MDLGLCLVSWTPDPDLPRDLGQALPMPLGPLPALTLQTLGVSNVSPAAPVRLAQLVGIRADSTGQPCVLALALCRGCWERMGLRPRH